MKVTEAMKKFRLPNPTTPEDLEMHFSGMNGKVVNFGDRVVMAGHYYQHNKPCYFGAIYEYLDKDAKRNCESALGLHEVSEVEFKDDGHAIAWAMNQ